MCLLREMGIKGIETMKGGPMGYAQYSYFASFDHRDPETLWCFNENEPNYRLRPDKVVVWFLVYLEGQGKHTIFLRPITNEANLTLKQLLSTIHKTFLRSVNASFDRRYQLEGLKAETMEIIGITPYTHD